MKKFELSAYGVEEMNQKENCVTSGGWIPLAISWNSRIIRYTN